MASQIPFIYSKTDCKNINTYYSDSRIVRVGLDNIEELQGALPEEMGIWIDPTVDGFYGDEVQRLRKPPKNAKPGKERQEDRWLPFIRKFNNADKLLEPEFIEKPNKNDLALFVGSIMDACRDSISKPDKLEWISVPQFPHIDNSSHNKINRMLAESAGKWREQRKFKGKLILPAIFALKSQLENKTNRNEKVNLIDRAVHRSAADGIWTVQSALRECEASEGSTNQQFPALIHLQKEITARIKPRQGFARIVGPYWGMNLVLWARGLAEHPAISLGTGYTYYLSGGFARPGKSRMMLTPLRRFEDVTNYQAFLRWIDKALEVLKKSGFGDSAQREFKELQKLLKLGNKEQYKGHVCDRYMGWLKMIESNPVEGRAVALYQDLSSAFVLGRLLPPFPREKGKEKKKISMISPGELAKALMLNCL